MSKSACLVAEETSASKNELDEISKIMSAMSAMSVQIPEDAPAPSETVRESTPETPAEAPPTVLPEAPQPDVQTPKADEEIDKKVLGDADPYFKTSSDEDL